MARRKGDSWWAAAMTNNDGGKESIDLSFLEPGKKYMAEIYTDGGEKVKTYTHIRIEKKKVTSKDILHFDLQPRGGAAVKISPLE